MANEQYSNLAQTSLTAAYTAGDGTTTVGNSGGNFPTNPNFHIGIYDKLTGVNKVLLKVTSIISATKFAVTAEGSDANANNGDLIYHIITKGALDQIRQDIMQQGAASTIPSTASTGAIYLATDGMFKHHWNGSSWDYYYGDLYVTPPLTANFTTATVGAMTVTTTDSAWFGVMTASDTVLYRLSGQFKTLATSANYTVTIGFIPLAIGNSFNEVDLILRDSTTGRMVSHGLFFSPGTAGTATGLDHGLEVITWTNTATLSGSPFLQYGITESTPAWLRIQDNGTNRLFSYSCDGRNFLVYGSHTRTTYITPDQVGFGINAINGVGHGANSAFGCTFIHFGETAP